MGQRAFRGQLTDSIIKNYLSDDKCSYSTGTSSTSVEDYYYFQGKPIDLNIEFNLDNPLHNISDLNTILKKGLINAKIQKGTKVNNLNLKITSNLFGTNMTYLHGNLYVVFGSYFYRDIKNIQITLFNPFTKTYHNDRKTINGILEFMCFKTIKAVNINKGLTYYVIPEYSEFAIVLAYRDVNFYEKKYFNFKECLEDIIFHPYCTFDKTKENLNRCLNAIEKTIPKEVNNIILPIINFYNLNEQFFGEESNSYFPNFKNFIVEILNKFKIVSLELKIIFEEVNDKNKILENYKIFINRIINENLDTLRKFTHCFFSFNFDNLELYNSYFCPMNIEILNCFKKILIENKIKNLTFTNHTNYSLLNPNTNLQDQVDYYDYVFYDKILGDRIVSVLLSFKNNEKLRVLYRKKVILQNILRKTFDLDNLFNNGRVNYSTSWVKNLKIVPFEVSRDNVMIFTN